MFLLYSYTKKRCQSYTRWDWISLSPQAAVLQIKKKVKGKIHFHFDLFLLCDPVGIQTQDLQNRNLTFYSAELRSLYEEFS